MLFIEGSSGYVLKRAFNEADVILKTRIMNMYSNIPERLEIREWDGVITLNDGSELREKFQLITNPSKVTEKGNCAINNIIGVNDTSMLFRKVQAPLDKTILIDVIEPKAILPVPKYTQGLITVERWTKLGKQLPPSYVYALEGSVEKARGITGSDCTIDEAAYTENLKRVYVAIRPAMEFLQLISSPRISQFMEFFSKINV